jgi:hypothetical protein
VTGPWDLPAGWRSTNLAATVERLASEMRRKEAAWLEAALRSQMPPWLLRTLDRNMRWPAKLWIKWNRLHVKVTAEEDGKRLEVFLGDKLRRSARSQVKNNLWTITEATDARN